MGILGFRLGIISEIGMLLVIIFYVVFECLSDCLSYVVCVGLRKVELVFSWVWWFGELCL